MLREIVKPPHEMEVLDFGMGWSEWLQMARAWGCRVTGMELSEERVRHARSLGIEIIDLDDAAGRRFDFINTEQVFEHLVSPLDILERLGSLLKPGGLLKVSVPDGRKMPKVIDDLASGGQWSPERVMAIAPLEHVNCFTYDSIVAMGKAAGLRVSTPRLRDMLNASSGWLSPKEAARNLARPVYRHLYPRSTYVFLTRD